MKIFDISLKASSLATHGMTEKTKVSQFRLTSEIINAFIHNKWTMGVRFGNKFCRKKNFLLLTVYVEDNNYATVKNARSR